MEFLQTGTKKVLFGVSRTNMFITLTLDNYKKGINQPTDS